MGKNVSKAVKDNVKIVRGSSVVDFCEEVFGTSEDMANDSENRSNEIHRYGYFLSNGTWENVYRSYIEMESPSGRILFCKLFEFYKEIYEINSRHYNKKREKYQIIIIK